MAHTHCESNKQAGRGVGSNMQRVWGGRGDKEPCGAGNQPQRGEVGVE